MLFYQLINTLRTPEPPIIPCSPEDIPSLFNLFSKLTKPSLQLLHQTRFQLSNFVYTDDLLVLIRVDDVGIQFTAERTWQIQCSIPPLVLQRGFLLRTCGP